jgi:hypothetical protein
LASIYATMYELSPPDEVFAFDANKLNAPDMMRLA